MQAILLGFFQQKKMVPRKNVQHTPPYYRSKSSKHSENHVFCGADQGRTAKVRYTYKIGVIYYHHDYPNTWSLSRPNYYVGERGGKRPDLTLFGRCVQLTAILYH